MPSPEDIASVERRLEQYRRNLRRLLEREAGYGPLNVPTELSNEIEETQARIHQLEEELRAWNSQVEDIPGDTNTPSPSQPSLPISTKQFISVLIAVVVIIVLFIFTNITLRANGPPVADTNVFFRITSDWGSDYPNQEVKYTLVLRNTRPSNAPSPNLQNISVTSNLPGNLDVLAATADRGEARKNGNAVQLALASLAPGETVELAITTRIKANVPRGTLIVAQGQLRYDGLTTPLFSNVVTLLVVEATPTEAATPTEEATPTETPTSTGVLLQTFATGGLSHT